MNSKEPLAKPSGISLADHTRHVVEETEAILRAWPFLEKKFRQLTGQELRPLVLAAAEWHDTGKKHPQWQDACRKDYEEYRTWRRRQGIDPDVVDAVDHRRYELEMRQKGVMTGKHLFKAQLRHEFASLLQVDQQRVELSPEVRAAIAAHHGKLGHRDEKRWYEDGRLPGKDSGPFGHLWEDLRRQDERGTSFKKNRDRIINRYRFSAVRALLELADTRASRMESEGRGALVDLKPFELKKHFDHLRPVQKAAVDLAGEPFSILRAPTGSGKTYASLLWADQQMSLQRADRLIVAMPTRFTSNALAISVTDQMGETGLYHSSAWHNHYRTREEGKNLTREMLRMAKLLAAPVTVCTIDHLLICLTGAREHHHSGFFFLANSAVVFDEADFYDPFVQANLVKLLEVLRILEVPVLIMSATVPNSARELYQVASPIKSAEHDPEDPIPAKTLRWAGPAEHPEDVSDILREMLRTGSGIIYANTIARALAYYRFLDENQPAEKVDVVIYHSRFTEPHKKTIEERLIAMLGKDAWKKNNTAPKGIAVLTQIGEMSVNISAPVMLSDACPWDRLAQRLGRLLRFGEREQGRCYVVEPRKNGVYYPAPYGEYDRGQKIWKAYPAMMETLRELQQIGDAELVVTPDVLVDKVNRLFPKAPVFSGSAESNQRELAKLIKINWLILPNTRIDDLEENQIGDRWSSRQIPPQNVVFIEVQPHFRNFDEYYEFALEYGVACPVYQIEKELRRGTERRIQFLSPRTIGEKGQEVNMIYTGYYSEEKGLAFLYED